MQCGVARRVAAWYTSIMAKESAAEFDDEIRVRCPKKLKDELIREAAEDDRDLSYYVRKILESRPKRSKSSK